MKILSASQLRQADEHTVKVQGISSWQLMERASEALLRRLEEDFGESTPQGLTLRYVLFCGPGNNGGDGLALARMLAERGRPVEVYLVESRCYSPDNLKNQERLRATLRDQAAPPMQILSLDQELDRDIDSVGLDTVLIDALFGYGLSRALAPGWAPLIGWINRHQGPVISIDMPSGLFADRPSEPDTPIVRATLTYTFHAPKLGLLQPDNAVFSGKSVVLDIGLDTGSLPLESLNYQYIQAAQVQAFVPSVGRFSHKGTFGHALLAGGSHGKIGAVVLSSRAALRTGCGLVTAFVPACGYEIMQTAFPEAMVWTAGKHRDLVAELPSGNNLSVFKAVGLGMGMGTAELTKRAFKAFLAELPSLENAPALVLDADALNILSEDRDPLAFIPRNTILTPHPRELERLIGPWENDWQKLEKTQAFARGHGAIVLIKGANTAVVMPDGSIHFNSTGNWGMATGGSGDVLTGMITSLLAQGFSPAAAAITGVYLHGAAGDLASRTIHPRSLIASDLIGHIGEAWKELNRCGNTEA